MDTDRKLNVGSAFLCFFGAYGIFQGLYALLFPKQLLDSIATMLSESAPTLTTADYYLSQSFGLFASLGSVLFIIVSLIPYRKGEKWAWYTILAVGFLMVSGAVILYVLAISDSTALINSLYVLSLFTLTWLLGLAIPSKEILGKHPP
jgi:hypothetical protein